MRIRSVFPANLAPLSPTLFQETWDELKALAAAYGVMFIEDQRQGRLEDDDNLPYTLDWLVLEELDFLQACLRAGPVRKQLESQNTTIDNVLSWIVELMPLLVSYSQITTEEEGLWNIDVNIFLSEEYGTTPNYTPRSACGDLIVKLCEWVKTSALDGLLVHFRRVYGSSISWKANEATLYILTQILTVFAEEDIELDAQKANSFVDFIRYAMQQPDEFLRARGYLVGGSLTRCAGGSIGTSFIDPTLHALQNDESEVVKVACVRALQFYLEKPALPGVANMQGAILGALAAYVSMEDMTERVESDDFLANLAQTVRDVISLDPKICLQGEGLNLLFNIANYGANMFTVSSIVNETFEEIVSLIADAGHEAYTQLCSKVLPSLTGAFHISTLTEVNALTNLAADLLAILTSRGVEPMPPGFVATVMPKLNRILMDSNDDELLKSATCSVKNMLLHDHVQIFEWHDETGKGGLEVILVIIDRLLGPTVDDNSGAEVGGLAAELVEKAGHERLGPFLPQLLRAVAVRLASAEKAQFIQSLILVFARLALVNTKEIVDFLGEQQIGHDNGLQVVITKWLENSVNFAGYDEIRQKFVFQFGFVQACLTKFSVIALSKMYDLNDPRLAQIQVKGDLMVPMDDGRIMTRSRAKIRKLRHRSIALINPLQNPIDIQRYQQTSRS
jgi:importin-9